MIGSQIDAGCSQSFPFPRDILDDEAQLEGVSVCAARSSPSQNVLLSNNSIETMPVPQRNPVHHRNAWCAGLDISHLEPECVAIKGQHRLKVTDEEVDLEQTHRRHHALCPRPVPCIEHMMPAPARLS